MHTHAHIHTSYIPHALNTMEGKLSSNKEMVSMLSNLTSRQRLGISQTKNMAEVMPCDSAMEEYSVHFAVCPSFSFLLLLPPSPFLHPSSFFPLPSSSLLTLIPLLSSPASHSHWNIWLCLQINHKAESLWSFIQC